MRNIFIIELKKALGKNPWFWGSLAAGVLFASLSALQGYVIFSNTLSEALELWNIEDVGYSSVGCYALWLPIRTSEIAAGVFFLVWPLIVALPYAWAWNEERTCGLEAQAAVRAGRKYTLAAKLLATWVTGSLCITVPYLINLVTCACFAPAMPLLASDLIYHAVGPDALFSSLLFMHPLGFCILWTCLAGCIAGLWAVAVSSVAVAMESFSKAYVGSYLFLIVLSFVGGKLRLSVGEAIGKNVVRSALLGMDVMHALAVRSLPHVAAAFILLFIALLLFIGLSLWVFIRRDYL
ncbi:MAG: hypothetical protein KIC37_04235 [Coriobacteriaceae bacterium]|nr:hypothetical protein [Coriobacteriaceae bacterium]